MDEDTRVCFRCKGLAVIDKSVLTYLPGILNRASALLAELDYVDSPGPATDQHLDRDEIYNLRESLRQYAILLEGLPDGD